MFNICLLTPIMHLQISFKFLHLSGNMIFHNSQNLFFSIVSDTYSFPALIYYSLFKRICLFQYDEIYGPFSPPLPTNSYGLRSSYCTFRTSRNPQALEHNAKVRKKVPQQCSTQCCNFPIRFFEKCVIIAAFPLIEDQHLPGSEMPTFISMNEEFPQGLAIRTYSSYTRYIFMVWRGSCLCRSTVSWA